MDFKIGFGYDVHQLVFGRDLILGGIKIDFEKGLIGHSDADVVIHAICDSILGAINLGDIGSNFPDTDSKYKDIDSKILLNNVCNLMSDQNYIINNIDVTICFQELKINNYILKMKSCLAPILNIKENQISIKATTTEKLGFVGRGEGISCYSISLLRKVQ